MPARKKTRNGLPKRQVGPRKGPKKQRTNAGARGELLPGDGLTFTTLTRLPRTQIIPSKEYSIVQSYTLEAWFSTSTTIPTFASFNTALSAFGQASAFANLFDQYMINSVEVWLMPRYSLAASNLVSGILHSVVDIDDSNLLTTVSSASDYSNCVTTESSQGHYRHFTPHVAIAAYAGAFTSFSNKAYVWIDAASPSVEHYGFKTASSVTPGVVIYDLNVKALLRFRNVR